MIIKILLFVFILFILPTCFMYFGDLIFDIIISNCANEKKRSRLLDLFFCFWCGIFVSL